MQLITNTSEAVAVDENLTTLIDWTNIENFSGFTIMVENIGGGSANAISDVQIDTSEDAGITVNTDQHPGVPAIPIASGAIEKGTFTETSKFVRIRAQCGEGEDTTSEAYLLADSAAALICTLADIKERLGISSADNDITINTIIAGIEAIFNEYTDRILLLNATETTEYYNGGSQWLQLRRYPIVSITSIKEAPDYDFASVDALEANSDYRLVKNGDKGILYRLYTNWYQSPDAIQVIYKGGFCAAGVTPAAGEFILPADMREAAIEQACFIFKRRKDLGLAAVGFQGGSISKFSQIELLPNVRQILAHYKRTFI